MPPPEKTQEKSKSVCTTKPVEKKPADIYLTVRMVLHVRTDHSRPTPRLPTNRACEILEFENALHQICKAEPHKIVTHKNTFK
jgi:hypothetical protein